MPKKSAKINKSQKKKQQVLSNEAPATSFLMCSVGINPKFRGIMVMTTDKEVKDMIETHRERLETKVSLDNSENSPDDDPDGLPPNSIVVKLTRFDGAGMLTDVRAELRKYSHQELLDMPTTTQSWVDWCNNVLIYYTLRFVLSGESIPVMMKPDE